MVIQGQLRHTISADDQPLSLEPGAYFGSDRAAKHHRKRKEELAAAKNNLESAEDVLRSAMKKNLEELRERLGYQEGQPTKYKFIDGSKTYEVEYVEASDEKVKMKEIKEPAKKKSAKKKAAKKKSA